MDQSSLNPPEGRRRKRFVLRTGSSSPFRTGRVSLSPDTAICSLSARHYAVTRLVTSRVTYEFNKSPNCERSPHFYCSCLQRRRASVMRWSRAHRDCVVSRLGNLKLRCSDVSFGDRGENGHRRKPRHCRLIQTEGLPCQIIPISGYLKSHRDTKREYVKLNERFAVRLHSTRSNDFLIHDSTTTDGDVETIQGTDLSYLHQKDKSQQLDMLEARQSDLLAKRTAPDGNTSAVCISKLESIMWRVFCSILDIASMLMRPRRLFWQDGSRLARSITGSPWTLFTPMPFHKWIIFLLVCIMVFPPSSSGAPPDRSGVEQENGPQPGFKNSWYGKLPPKAEYESVIICLLAVSAFIGLIVWVLKSNFEERQQKRMRREASLRERSSSLGFLKT